MCVEESVLFYYYAAGQAPQLIQRKKTFYQDWNKCFDVDLYTGRIIQMLIMHGQRPLADATVKMHDLSNKCKEDVVMNLWVSSDFITVYILFRSHFLLNDDDDNDDDDEE